MLNKVNQINILLKINQINIVLKMQIIKQNKQRERNIIKNYIIINKVYEYLPIQVAN